MKFQYGIEPIAHISPRPPIELQRRHAVTMGGDPNVYRPCSPAECDRIWSLVKGAAEGSNIAAKPQPEVNAGESYRVNDDWDGA